MNLSVRENIDFLLGGTFLATAPILPRVCDIMTTGELNDGLTLLIQVLSVVLILMRIRKAGTDESKDEKTS